MRKQTLFYVFGILGCGIVLAIAEQKPNPNAPVVASPSVQQHKPTVQSTVPPPAVQPNNPAGQIKPGIVKSPGVTQDNPEAMKALARRVFDELFAGRYEGIDQIYARDCSVHHRGQFYRFEDAVAEGKGWRSAAPDLRMLTEQMSVQGNIVTVQWTAMGTHTGRGNGLLKPTGKHILIRGNSRFRVVNGKIAEVWNDYDRDEIFRQVGVNRTMGSLFDASQAVWLTVNHFFTGTSEVAGLANTQ